MKKVFTLIIFSLFIIVGVAIGQPGGYDWIAEFDGNYGNIRTFSSNTPVTGIHSLTVQATSNTDEYVIEWDSFNNKWQNGSTTLNVETILYHGDNASPNGVLSSNASQNKYYTIQIEGLAYSNRNAVFMETTNTPQSFHATAGTAVSTPSAIHPGMPATIDVTLADSKSPEERVFIRYSVDNWGTSDVVEASGTGSDWSTASAVIPATVNLASRTIRYYAYTTTVAANSSSNHDLITLRIANNSGTNYSYTVAAGWNTSNPGDWSTPGTWTANTVPSSSNNLGTVTINHNVTMDQNATVGSLTIATGITLTASDATARTLTMSDGGTLTNKMALS